MRANTLMVATLALAASTAACGDRVATQPENGYRSPPNPAGPMIRSSSGLLVTKGRMLELLTLLTQQTSIALRNDNVRTAVYDALHASRYPEHKLHFRTFLNGAGQPLLAAIANARGGREPAVLSALDSIVDLEFYMPEKEHWARWDGGPDLAVATDLTDDDDVPPMVIHLSGDYVALGTNGEAPGVPSLALVPVETDFSRIPPAPGSSQASRAPMDDPGIWMQYANVVDDKEGFPNGDPELEVHVFVDRSPDYLLYDKWCAGKQQDSPSQYDQNDQEWSGSVELAPLSQMNLQQGDNAVAISMWENDSEWQCGPGTGYGSGKPPEVNGAVNEDFLYWSPRPMLSSSYMGTYWNISFQSYWSDVVLDDYAATNDDPVGELQLPVETCWPSSGPVTYTIYEPEEGHPGNGYARINFTYGNRDPLCPFSIYLSGPTVGQPYEWVTITATPYNYVSPVNYSWTVNGESACGNESTCSAPLGDQATYTYFHVTASDATYSSFWGDWPVFAECTTPPCDNRPSQSTVRARPAPGGPGPRQPRSGLPVRRPPDR